MKFTGIFIVLFIIVIGSAGFLYLGKSKNTTENKTKNISKSQESKTSSEDLVITPQIPQGKVTVTSATLSKNGFVVVRQMDDGKLSQIIEMSKPLKTGTSKDITISLGDADVKNKELIVMIYEDYANDGIFNDLDMPAIDKNGFMIARYVQTGKPLPSTITEADAPVMNMPGMKTMAKVRYTDKGFVPDKIEVPVNSMVEFINESSKDMWVASVPHPQHTKLPTFDQFRLYKKGAIYRYVFDKKGTWEYHDHINPSAGGVVNVN